jgi:hypothetical protein
MVDGVTKALTLLPRPLHPSRQSKSTNMKEESKSEGHLAYFTAQKRPGSRQQATYLSTFNDNDNGAVDA